MESMEFISESYEETVDFARGLDFPAGTVICLYGGLGAGKTAFVQGLAKGLGVKEYITSPTFTIVNVYESGKMPLYHFDMYRLGDCGEAYEVGYEEYVYGGGVSVIEWAENIAGILPDNRYDIRISTDASRGGNFRKFEITRVER